jgi:hypothetical protein
MCIWKGMCRSINYAYVRGGECIISPMLFVNYKSETCNIFEPLIKCCYWTYDNYLKTSL